MNHISRIQSQSRSAAHVVALPSPAGSVRWLNAALLIASLLLLLYYVMQVNALAAHAWNMHQANDRLSALHDQHDVLVAQASSLDDRQALTDLVKREGLVPADAVAYLVQDRAVAAVR